MEREGDGGEEVLGIAELRGAEEAEGGEILERGRIRLRPSPSSGALAAIAAQSFILQVSL